MFEGSQFNGGADFTGSHFSGLAAFGLTHFSLMAAFTSAEFGGGAQFFYATFSSNIAPDIFRRPPVTFEQAHFASQADFRNADFQDNTDFSKARIDVAVTFDNARFMRGVDFSDCTVTTVSFLTNRLSRGREMFGGPVVWTNCALERIDADWPSLAKQLVYDSHLYSQLEKGYRASGHAREAREIFLKRQNEDRKKLWGSDYWHWSLSELSNLGINYGDEPWRLVVALIALIVIGAFVFSSRNALQVKPALAATGVTAPAHRSFWLALAVVIACCVPSKLLPERFLSRLTVEPSTLPVIPKAKITFAAFGDILAWVGFIVFGLLVLVFGLDFVGLLPGKA